MNDNTTSTLSSVERKIHAIKNTLPKPLEPTQEKPSRDTSAEPSDTISSQAPNQALLLLEDTPKDIQKSIQDNSPARNRAEDPAVPQEGKQDNTELALRVDNAKDVAQDHSLQLVTQVLEASESTSDDGIKAAINEGLAAANQQVLQAQDAIQTHLQPEETTQAALENIATRTSILKQMLGDDTDNAHDTDEATVDITVDATVDAEVDVEVDATVVSLEQPIQQHDKQHNVMDSALWTNSLPPKEKLEAELLQQLPEATETKALDYIKQHKQLEKIQYEDMPLNDGVLEQEKNHLRNQPPNDKIGEQVDAADLLATDISKEGVTAETLDEDELASQLLLEATEGITQSELADKPVRQDNPIFHWMISPITRARKRRAEKERIAQEEREAAKQAAQAALEQAQLEQAQREQAQPEQEATQEEAETLAQPENEKQADTLDTVEAKDLQDAATETVDNEPKTVEGIDAPDAEKTAVQTADNLQPADIATDVAMDVATGVATEVATEVRASSLLGRKPEIAHHHINPLSQKPTEASQLSAAKEREEEVAEIAAAESVKGTTATSEKTTHESKTEAKEIADAVEASSVDSSEDEDVLEPQEAIAGDEAAQLEAEGISEENPELKHNESTLQWWGDYQMDVNEMGLWQIGPTSIEIHRLEHEWRIVTETGENPLDSTMEVFYPLPSSQPSLDSKMRRYMFHKSAGIVNLQPNLADRAIIVKPETPFEVRNGEQITMYVSTPVWVKITTPGTPNPLRNIASFRSPDIWYGEDTRTGELCYYSKLLGQLTLEGVQRRPYRAVTPMVLQNRSKEPLLIERIRLPMRYLSLYAAKDNFLWTSKLYLIQRRNNHTRIRVDRGAPHEMGEHHLIAHAELKMPRYLRMSAFSRFTFARGGDA